MSPKLKDKILAFLFVCLFSVLTMFLLRYKGVSIKLDDFTHNGIKRVYARANLEQRAKELAEEGDLEKAMQLYAQAIQPQHINQEHEKSTAIGALTDIYIWRCEYEKALQTYAWFLRHDVAAESALEKKQEILALMEYRDSGESDLVRKHINVLKLKYGKWLPPIIYNTYTPALISDLIRLYNTIGDHDSGIKFINNILNWTFDTDDQFKHLNGVVQTSDQAAKCAKFDGDPKSDWRECKWLREYLLIREAFEQDKSDGFKGCAHSPPGQVCMGKATKALIQSDYFPW